MVPPTKSVHSARAQVSRLAERNAALTMRVASLAPLEEEVATLHAVKARLAEEVRLIWLLPSVWAAGACLCTDTARLACACLLCFWQILAAPDHCLHAVKARLAEEVRMPRRPCWGVANMRVHLSRGCHLSWQLRQHAQQQLAVRSALTSEARGCVLLPPRQVTFLTATNGDLERRLANDAREGAPGQLVALRSEVRAHTSPNQKLTGFPVW